MKNKKVVIISIIIVVCIIIAFCVLGYFAKNKISKNRISENKENIENTTDNILSQYNEIFINDISDEGNSIINSLENAIDNSMDNEIENTSVDNTQQDSQSTTPIAKNTSNDNSNISNNIEISNPTTQNQSNTNTSSITKSTYQKLSYGESENGRDLTYYSIAPANYTSTILLNFAIHGYEDAYARDAKLLVEVAGYLKEYYQEKSEEELYETRLLIIPCANPDGLYEGTSNNGFGRCNAKGIDLNRDFDALHKVFNSARNYTQYPFSAKESQALRDLVYDEKPNVVLDLHGWENCTIGDASVASAFKTHVGLRHKTAFNSNCNGYFSYWAHLQGAESLLVEFTNTNIPKEKVAKAIDELLEKF